MKPTKLWPLVFTAIILAASFVAVGRAVADDEKQDEEKQQGQILFDCPDAPEPIVEINLTEKLIALVTKSMSAKAEAAELIKMLTGIYVRTYESAGIDAEALIGCYEEKLEAEKWELLAKVNTDEEKNQVRLLYDENVVSGIFVAVMTSEPEQITFVNIVGNIDAERIGELFANLGNVVDVDIDVEKSKEREDTSSQDASSDEAN